VNLERQRSIDKIFQDVLDQPIHERAAFLDSACADDPSLKPEVKKLIRSFEAAASFLETSPASSLIGRALGSYRVKKLLGIGGMGHVYLASDSKLKRDVAIKVLPNEFCRDPERVSRFQREAELLASLNHPHIATIYDFVNLGDVRFLVLELVEGETLADRLARGPISLDQALPLAKQIAEALEAAHDKGIVHRDLKPANVKIMPGDIIKVLDFGLAKTLGNGEASTPPFGLAGTNRNIVLGTPAYMSPEQAKGQTVDRRTDIFAFGCVLYEMLTGRPTFSGESGTEILGRVMTSEPDWSRLPAGTPWLIQRLLRRMLKKDTRQRLGDIRDARLEIEEIGMETEGLVATGRKIQLAWIVAGTAVLLAAVLAVPAIRHLRGSLLPSSSETRLQINTPSTTAPFEFALSPDGRNMVFVVSGSGPRRLWLRLLDKTDAQPLPGTDGAYYPFWSADSRSIGFFALGKLYRTDIAGGTPQELAKVAQGRGGSWNADGTILFAGASGPLWRITASESQPVAVTRLDPPRQNGHRLPQFLPDGNHFLFYTTGDSEGAGIYLGALDGREPKRLMPADVAGAYLPPGRLVFMRQGTLMTRPLDVQRGELVGDPITLADQVGYDNANQGGFSVSFDGRLAYRAGDAGRSQLVWFDRKGKALGAATEPDADGLVGPELSRDGQRVVGWRKVQNNADIWLLDLIRGGYTRFTFGATFDLFPIWSPDGTQIAFRSDRKGHNLYAKPSNGASSEQLLVQTLDAPQDWSKDGRFLLYFKVDAKTGRDLWALPMTGIDRKPLAVANTTFDEVAGQFSPDGRWVAYETNESGRFEVVVQSFPEPNGKWPVSTNGGTQPRWDPDGREIYFIAPDGRLMAAPVLTREKGSAFEAGTPVSLFPTRMSGTTIVIKPEYAVSRDGRFLINQQIEESTVVPITVILNWRGKP